ncbi:glycosyltransferase family A protein [uncultured Aquincola sp.]|uniref:glycosyltransferase family 2 protein n=1 Tax=uncultured Aquincola sp. TaxID=886556 RepID=UPI0032B105DA
MTTAEPGQRPEIAVVMATYRRPELLRRCLEAVVRQSLAGDRYEVLVVDDGPDDDTRRVVAEFDAATGGAPAVRYLRNMGKGPATARNVGWRASAAPLIAFTDDDTVPDRDWLSEGLAAMARGAAAASGRVQVPVQGAPTDHARMTQGLETAEFVTANAFVRRDILQRVGGFDERFKRAWREDSDLHFAILTLGAEVIRAERAVVLHPVRPAPWGISLGQQKNVVFDGLLYKKHRELFRRKVRTQPPWLYVGIVGLTGAALLALAAGAPRAAGWCAAGALLGIGRFAWQRLRGSSHEPAHVWEMLCTSAAIPFLALWWRVVGAWRFKVIYP